MTFLITPLESLVLRSIVPVIDWFKSITTQIKFATKTIKIKSPKFDSPVDSIIKLYKYSGTNKFKADDIL